MKLFSTIIALSSLLPLVSAQDTASSTDANDYIFKLTNETQFLEWNQEVEKAVNELKDGNNHRSSSLDKFFMALSGLFVDAKEEFKCKACQVGVGALSLITHVPFTKGAVISAVGKLCQAASDQPESVCNGIAQSTGSELYDVLYYINRDDPYVRQVACVSLGDVCPFPDIGVNALQLPEGPKNPPKEKESNEFKYILHLSDLHYDAEYLVGAETNCNKPICCQKDSNSDLKDQAVKKPAGKWGDYKCDANKDLLQSLLKNAIKTSTKYPLEMILFSGDVPAHDFWKESVERTEGIEKGAFDLLSSYLIPKKNKLYPTIGNHEAVPVNQFMVDGKSDKKFLRLYNFISEQWKEWLPQQALTSIQKNGYYSIEHNSDLKVISLNDNLCYKFNFQLLLDPSNSDINNMLKWFIQELDQSEKKAQKVYVVSHVSPGSSDCFKHWSLQYNSISQRYKSTIVGQFFGHEHYDTFEISYDARSNKTEETAFQVGYLAPSMSTLGGHNPSFRIYKVDASNYKVVDYFHYSADLKEASKWTDDMEWKLLYTARDTYNPSYTGKYLDSKFWHNVVNKMKTDNELFNRYYQLRNSHGAQQEACDEKCREKFLCILTAGYSGQSCNKGQGFA
ncbi:sphingomyelin phosphodiesterase [Neoconidiobolus thromboides FSU 785]|nr:sphingomyelin phosphodiesterase [Neoconidiobolus thromboides FSU 785]